MQILKQNKATLNDMGNSMDLLGESNEAHIKMQAAMLMFCCTRSRMPRVVVFIVFSLRSVRIKLRGGILYVQNILDTLGPLRTV